MIPENVELSSPSLYINRELSLLEFQRRVLEEALDDRNPLLERVKFLGIFGSNMDEFFMVRVSGIRKQVEAHTGLSRSTIYAWVRDGIFPAPISLGPKAVGWLQTDLDEWLAGRARASRTPATDKRA